ncbi:hypothetical protein MMC25_008130 [Agyrium rufum]|nr:hypothetical protein [Agyrium rufum]
MATLCGSKGEEVRDTASSEDLSPPPKSPEFPAHLMETKSGRRDSINSSITVNTGGANDDNPRGPVSKSKSSAAAATGATTASAAPAKRGRKKKEPVTSSSTSLTVKDAANGASTIIATEVKEKKTRKPRSSTSAANPTQSRKRQKTEETDSKKTLAIISTHSDQRQISSSTPQPTSAARPASQTLLHFPTNNSNIPDNVILPHSPPAPAPTQMGQNEAITNLSYLGAGQTASSSISIPRPASSSGQHYDPIRSSTRESVPPYKPYSPTVPSISRGSNRASASPSIANLTDPPSALHMPAYAYAKSMSTSSTPQQYNSRPPPPAMISPTAYHTTLPMYPSPTYANRSSSMSNVQVTTAPPRRSPSPKPMPMDIDEKPSGPPPSQPEPSLKPSTVTKKSTNGPATSNTTSTPASNSSAAPSPKPMRAPKDKDASAIAKLPPLPSSAAARSLIGATSLFSGNPDAANDAVFLAPTVIVDVPLSADGNKYINFARVAEEKYGLDALYPRIAANKARLAKVAAASRALENASKERSGKGSANGNTKGASGDDEMSLDGSDGDDAEDGGDGSNVEMGGMKSGAGTDSGGGGGGNGTKGGDTAEEKPKRKRRMKADQYDRDDPFVDDTELAWEENAVASKDGFFVYSGPLVPEGEKITVERADGTIRKPRGTRNRGGGASGRGASSSAAAAAAAASKDTTTNATTMITSTRGGSSTLRGQTTTRKPRMKKADRALLELEKAERERAGIAAAAATKGDSLAGNTNGVGSTTATGGGAGRGAGGAGRGGGGVGSGMGRGGSAATAATPSPGRGGMLESMGPGVGRGVEIGSG